MAVDEALFANGATPILRFYRWRQPSLSFGYFGRYSDAVGEANGREVVRRWTGGGIVPHGEDLTYSVIIPKVDPFFARSSLEIYAAVHDAIRRALDVNKIPATLAGAAAARISENCFANPVRADVISGGRKVAGAAHRRSRAGLLHQGSIQHDLLPDRFRADFAQALCEEAEPRTLSQEILASAASIAKTKYATVEWLTRR
jgi:lipoate-protein ligase A